MEKRASEKYYILMSLILGLVVLSISLYFIFNEIFVEDDLNWEQCRQSIYLRSIAPDFHKITDMKDAVPLKCKTEVINIDTAEPNKVYRKISEVVQAGWYLYGEGKYDIVPRPLLASKNYCMVFARVHFSDKAKKQFDERLGLRASVIENVLKPKEVDAVTGLDYSPIIEPLKRYVKYNSDFFKYYSTTRMKNSEENYNDYLPLLSANTNSDYVWFKEEISPNSGDLLFIYRVPKESGARSSIVGNIATGVAIGTIGVITFPVSFPAGLAVFAAGIGLSISGDKNFFDLENLWKNIADKKAIIVTSTDDVNNIGCDEFLTIPA